jgi:predicted dehydrogenase
MGRVIRVLLVGRAGLGPTQDHQSAMYGPALVAHPGFEVVGEAEGVDDLHGVDAVSVCVPPAERADVIIAALRAGKHVLADKPLAPTPAEVRRIAAAAGAPVLAVAHHQRFQPLLLTAAAALAAGRVGLPWNVQADFLVAGGDPVPGGDLDNLGCYPVDVLLALTGQPVRRVYARAAGPGLHLLCLDHDRGLTSTVLVGRTGPRLGVPPGGLAVHRYRVAGTHGTATFDATKPAVLAHSATALDRHSVDRGTVSRLLDEWHGAITGGRPCAVSVAAALAVAEVLAAARASLESDRPEPVGHEGENP